MNFCDRNGDARQHGRCRRLILLCCLFLALLFGLAASQACATPPVPETPAPWPAKPVRLVVGYAAGSTTDLVARLLAYALAPIWPVPVHVENHGGAAGMMAADLVARGTADGYQVLVAQNALAIRAATAAGGAAHGDAADDPLRKLTPVAPLASTPHVLVVAAASPVRSVDDLVALGRGHGQGPALSFGSSGVGNADHLVAELFGQRAGVQALHVPYRGGSLATAALLGRQIDYYFAGLPVALPHLRAGRLRALAVTSRLRHPALPSVPTLAQAGVPGVVMALWQGVFVPVATPPAVVAKLAGDIQQALTTADVRGRMADAGLLPYDATPGAFAADVRAEVARWRDLIDATGLRLD